ncbi:MAG TPA: isocitrate dehydrogenase (NAD(+)) [Candidatus Binatia bacterium]|nr:isocitrate dehydrogenase (NAD(+)) [Candidatus Binatia bacterium]
MSMKHKITLIPGDGIGPEVTKPTLQIIKAAGVKVDWESHLAGAEALKQHKTTIPQALMDSFEKNRVALKGPVTTPVGEGFASVNVALRQTFNLYANLRPIKNLPGVKARYQGIDLIVVRENTEGLYSGIEHEVIPGVVESLKIMTERACTKIAKFAFEFAQRNGRKKVAAVHKANIMKLSDGLFLDCARKVSKGYKSIGFSDVIVDNACLQLVIDPWRFDILLMENLYGDILSDLAAGLVGGLGVVPGANLGDHHALFETVHGSAPDIKGKNIANPSAMILAAVLMLRHLSEKAAANRIALALERVLMRGEVMTRDLGGNASTTKFAEAIIREIEK